MPDQTDVLSTVSGLLQQPTLDYCIWCVRQDRIDNGVAVLIAEGVEPEMARQFLAQIADHINWDIHRVQVVKDTLKLNDDETIDMAETILRVYGKK